MMDRLMLMAQGKIIFFNEARLAVDYFAGINFRCPEMSNPADFFMGMMSIESANQIKVEEDEDDSKQKTKQEILEEYTQKIAFFSGSY